MHVDVSSRGKREKGRSKDEENLSDKIVESDGKKRTEMEKRKKNGSPPE